MHQIENIFVSFLDEVMKNITVKTGNGFHLTYTSNKKVTFCSVSTPFDEEELERRTKEKNVNQTSRILIHDEQDEKNDVKRYRPNLYFIRIR